MRRVSRHGGIGSLGTMHHSMKYVLLGLAMTCTTFLTGCASQNTSAGLGATVLEAALKPMFEPSVELARGANEFRDARIPKGSRPVLRPVGLASDFAA